MLQYNITNLYSERVPPEQRVRVFGYAYLYVSQSFDAETALVNKPIFNHKKKIVNSTG
jgi:hypothetical protein